MFIDYELLIRQHVYTVHYETLWGCVLNSPWLGIRNTWNRDSLKSACLYKEDSYSTGCIKKKAANTLLLNIDTNLNKDIIVKFWLKYYEVLPSGELQDFLQCPPEWHPLVRLAVWDHISAPICTQLNARPLHSNSLQPWLSDVPAKVHLHLLQTVSMSCHTLQAAVSDAYAVLQVEAAQLPAALQHGDHILVSDVSTARQC